MCTKALFLGSSIYQAQPLALSLGLCWIWPYIGTEEGPKSDNIDITIYCSTDHYFTWSLNAWKEKKLPIQARYD